jgi:hypothetical protein
MTGHQSAVRFDPSACTVDDFKAGDRVRFIPPSAHQDSHHPNCQTGTVTAVGSSFVYVRFVGDKVEPCDAEDLIKWPKR